VHRITEDGTVVDVVEVPDRPSGLGFMPNGDPLIVSMADRSVYRYVGGTLELHAALGDTVRADINDMVVDPEGRAYVGNFGYDLFNDAEPEDAEIVLIEPDGSHRVVASELMFPNGMVLTDGGATLVVAETFGQRLTAYERDADGGLVNRRVFAELGEMTPDGICLDVEGGIWVSSYMTGDFVRVLDGGEITDQFKVGERAAVACQLGGEDGRTLFCMTYSGQLEDVNSGARLARIDTVTVDIPGAGSP
ncbi:MAG TPA: SMP-30/gluconolactonase/LRE family protein, partial [Gammaproteobacteria bacterium]|nr:SMP-30/gluconolactonase/LRE family protein [Gammaproteobacteria bacterium]